MQAPDEERQLGELGLRLALERFRDADENVALVALADGLNWVHALQDYWRERLGEAYFREGAKHVEGQVTRGAIYARNAVHHNLSRVMSLAGWGTGRWGEFPWGGGLTWRPRDEFREPRPDPVGAKCYERHLEGKGVVQTLEDAQRFFVELLPTVAPDRTARNRPTDERRS